MSWCATVPVIAGKICLADSEERSVRGEVTVSSMAKGA